MTNPANHDSGVPTPAELMTNYLQTQAVLADADSPPSLANVELYEVISSRSIDAELAWSDAVVALVQGGVEPSERPSGWQALTDTVMQMGQTAALPLCLGNFPQLVRDFSKLLQAEKFAQSAPRPATQAHSTNRVEPVEVPKALAGWIAQQFQSGTPASKLTAVACLRLLGQFEHARTSLAELVEQLPEAFGVVLANERAGLLWASGELAEARTIWNGLPAGGPILFNRGLACLFNDEYGQAVELFGQSAAQLPESSGWHHLAMFYRTLGQMRVG